MMTFNFFSQPLQYAGAGKFRDASIAIDGGNGIPPGPPRDDDDPDRPEKPEVPPEHFSRLTALVGFGGTIAGSFFAYQSLNDPGQMLSKEHLTARCIEIGAALVGTWNFAQGVKMDPFYSKRTISLLACLAFVAHIGGAEGIGMLSKIFLKDLQYENVMRRTRPTLPQNLYFTNPPAPRP